MKVEWLGASRHSASVLMLAVVLVSVPVRAEEVGKPAVVSTAEAPKIINGPWQDAHRSPDERAKAAVAAMTPEEKVQLLHAPIGLMMSKAARGLIPLSAGFTLPIPRLGIISIGETDASLGVSNIGNLRYGDVATALPSSLSLGATWSPEIAYAGGKMIGSEARAKGFGIMLAGGVNLVRDPRGGRNFEYLSEDVLLTGVLGGQSIAGVQSAGIVSTIKHFALNDQETGRDVYSVDMSEATMRESDLLAFELAMEKGRPGSVMCAYNRVNSEYACHNSFLLTKVLREDWGFNGFVMSDWGAVKSSDALKAGLDQQSGYQLDKKRWLGTELISGLSAGTVAIDDVDRAAKRVLRTLYAAGVFDNPPQPGGAIDYAANARVALAQAEAGIVLLANQKKALPLSAATKRIAVIGGHADIGVLSGGGSTQVTPVGGVKLAVPLKEGSLANVVKRTYGGSAPLDEIKAAFPDAKVDFADGSDPKAAAALARSADVAIVFGEKWATETDDVADLGLGDGQDELIASVASANPRTVVVLETGNPVAMPWKGKVAAILQAWYPGQEGAKAIANVLSGSVNPMGRLPITWPMTTAQLPNPKVPGTDAPLVENAKGSMVTAKEYKPFSVTYPEGADVGYRWFAKTGAKPLFPFGFGLSYTSFSYGRPAVTGGETMSVTFSVRNSGKVKGTEVAQVYVTPPGGTKRLVGWGRAELAPGESRSFTIEPDLRILAHFDTASQSWVRPAGTYKIEIARSSQDTVQRVSAVLNERRAKVDAFKQP